MVADQESASLGLAEVEVATMDLDPDWAEVVVEQVALQAPEVPLSILEKHPMRCWELSHSLLLVQERKELHS